MAPLPSKAEQIAESAARAAAGDDPAMNAQALDVIDDGARGDPQGEQGVRPARDGEQPAQTTPPVRAKFDSRREDIVSRFRAHRAEEKAGDTDEISQFARSGMPQEVEDEQDAPQPQQVDQQDDPQPEPQARQAEPPKHKLKVHGVEKEYTLEEIFAKAQIALASDNILDEAKSKAKDLDTLLQDMRNKVARADQPGANQPRQTSTQQAEVQPDPAADPANQGDSVNKLIEAMQFGDPNEASQLLENTISEKVVQGVNEALMQQRLADEGARTAKVLKDFEGKNPELAKDKKARAAIESEVLDIQIEDIRALGVDLNRLRPDGLEPTSDDIGAAHRWYRAKGFAVTPPETMLEKATANFLSWKGIKPDNQPAAPQPADKAPPRVDVTVDRSERRAAIQQQPSRAGVSPRPPAQQPAPVRDRSSIVQQEIARRNLPRGRIVA